MDVCYDSFRTKLAQFRYGEICAPTVQVAPREDHVILYTFAEIT
jgi:hypothetical protein